MANQSIPPSGATTSVPGIIQIAGSGDTTSTTKALTPGNATESFITSKTAFGATVDFTSGINSNFDAYDFELNGITVSTGDVQLQILASTDGGSTWIGASGYKYAVYYNTSGNGTGNIFNQTSAFIPGSLSGTGSGIGNASASSLSGRARLIKPASTSLSKIIDLETQYLDNGTPTIVSMRGAGAILTATAINAVRFQLSTGTFTGGTIAMKGRRLS